jgi:hypothetical protein
VKRVIASVLLLAALSACVGPPRERTAQTRRARLPNPSFDGGPIFSSGPGGNVETNGRSLSEMGPPPVPVAVDIAPARK